MRIYSSQKETNAILSVFLKVDNIIFAIHFCQIMFPMILKDDETAKSQTFAKCFSVSFEALRGVNK